MPYICTVPNKQVKLFILFKKLDSTTSVNEWTPHPYMPAPTGPAAEKAGTHQARRRYISKLCRSERVFASPKSAEEASSMECTDASDPPINPLAGLECSGRFIVICDPELKAMANSAPPGPKEFQAEKKRKEKNRQRNARRKMRRTQGPLFPYAVHIRAGPSRNQAISLTEWRTILTEAAGVAYNVIDARCKEGADQNDLMLHMASFVEHVPPELRAKGKKTSDRPAADRFGHGLCLFMKPEAKEIYNEAFNQVIFQRDGKSIKTYSARKRQNVRARYILRIQQPLWVPLQIADNFYTSMRRGDPNLPQENGIQLEQVKAAARFISTVDNKTKKVNITKVPEEKRGECLVIFSANKAWETALATANNKIKTPFGIFNLKKLNPGRSQEIQDETEAHTGYDDDEEPFEDADDNDDIMDLGDGNSDGGDANGGNADEGQAEPAAGPSGVANGTRSKTPQQNNGGRPKTQASPMCNSPAHKRLILQPPVGLNKNK